VKWKNKALLHNEILRSNKSKNKVIILLINHNAQIIQSLMMSIYHVVQKYECNPFTRNSISFERIAYYLWLWSYCNRSAKFDAKFFNFFARLFILFYFRSENFRRSVKRKIKQTSKRKSWKNFASNYADR